MIFKRHAHMVQGLEAVHFVPFLDVILLTMMFYMLTSSSSFSPKIDIKLPKAVLSGDLQESDLVLTITGENVIYLHEQIVSANDLKAFFNQSNRQKSSVLIKADRRASLGRIVDVWDLCRLAGIEKINIATDSPQ